MQDNPTPYSAAPAAYSTAPATRTGALLTPLAESRSSAVAWSSIAAGAVAILSVTGILMTIGGAAGLAPWNKGASSAMDAAKTMTAVAAIALVATQWIASGVGGYLTGRLRTKWTNVHTHEVYFRDTAHGFLAWSVAAIFTVVTLGSAISTAVGAHGGPGMDNHRPMMRHREMNGPGTDMAGGPMAYYVDQLYRRSGNQPNAPMINGDSVKVNGTEPQPTNVAPVANVVVPPPPVIPFNGPGDMSQDREETARVLAHASAQAEVPADDHDYLVNTVEQHAGLSAGDATTRVDNVVAHIREDATNARKAAAYVALFTGLSMLIGAFIAAAAAALGGAQRDEWEDAVVSGTYDPRV